MRASEQVRMNLGYMKHNVNLVALGSGVGMGYLGNSHFGLEDLSIIRAIPNLKFLLQQTLLNLEKSCMIIQLIQMDQVTLDLQVRLVVSMYIIRIIFINLEKTKK